MIPRKKGVVTVLCCTTCGHESCFSGENMEITSKKPPKKVSVQKTEDDAGAMPILPEQCKKCKNREAYFWTVQTRAADEPPTKFFRCTKCGHTWRDYS
jgi:DNA-directed RNA polymerase subunit M